MKIEISEIALFLVSFFILIFIFFLIPYGINKHIIKKRLLQQKKTFQTLIPNRLLAAGYVFRVELAYLFSMFWGAVPFIIGILFHIPEDSVKEMIHQIPFHIREDNISWLISLAYYMIALILFILLNLISLYVRKRLGKIQGVVLFDPKEKKVYMFPTIESDNYKEYHESELTYTIESFWNGGNHDPKAYDDPKAYVFFTKKENNFAFKVNNLEYNNFGVFLSLREDCEISIPSKYRFHTFITFIIALAVFIFGMIVILPLVR